MYNGINSSIDAFRGKHDTAGSMAAGAVTGALFKSTGTLIQHQLRIPADVTPLVSWHQARYCCCNGGVRHGRNLELCEKECLMGLLAFSLCILLQP